MLFHTKLGSQNDIMIMKTDDIPIIKYSNTHMYNPVLNSIKCVDGNVSNLSILVYTTTIVRELKKM